MGKYLLISCLAFAAFSASAQEVQKPYAPGTVLVVAPSKYPFAGVQIAGGIQGGVVVEMSLIQAFNIAKSDPNVTGVIDINLATDQAWETGRVICYSSAGKKVWQEKVFFNFGGGAERVAEKFTDKLAAKTRGKSCS